MSATLVPRLRAALAQPRAEDRSDADVLTAFAASRDEHAFATLVRRHGRLVLATARRATGNSADADDVFQATFLLLARKAGTLGRGDPVGAWLHGVAAHARADRARRRDRERRALKVATDNLTPAALWEDLRPVLDDEVGKLPTQYRVPVVLCYLGGQTYDEAAREIGCPKGTVATRLAKARELLRARLTARGIAPSAAVLAAALADHARALVPTSLLHTTVAGAAAGAAPPAVTTLAEEVMRVMPGTRLKVVGTLVVMVGLLAGGASTTGH